MQEEKILIVDDNKDFLDELQETLYLCGYDVKGVLYGEDACKVAGKIKPDLILMDLRMGKMNGFEVAQALKESQETADIPIIAMSGYFPIEKPGVLLDMKNMTGRIKKPFALADLVEKIESILGKKEMVLDKVSNSH